MSERVSLEAERPTAQAAARSRAQAAPPATGILRIEPHACFGCGDLNEIGLRLQFHPMPDGCWTELVVPERFQGFEGATHGGILATILDEAMHWSLTTLDLWAVTARMSITFKRPVVIGQRIRAEGRIVENRRRIVTAAGSIVDIETGVELASAEGTFVTVGETERRRLQERYGHPAESRRKAEREASATTAASNRFVAEHLAAATELGTRLADLAADPGAFAAALRQGFEAMADPIYAEGVRSVTPGLGPILGVRLPLMEATHKAFKRATKKAPTTLLLDCMDRLLREELRELRWFGIWNLGRLLPTDPERTWQLLRRAAAEADEWITVDTLAHPYAEGILRDWRRWAEVDLLVYSSSRWERRLVGSTLATLPHVNYPGGDDKIVVRQGLALIGLLIGDAEPDVQKALSWALRTFAKLDPSAVEAFATEEALTARRTHDGYRAWVIRDTLPKLPDDTASRLRISLDGVRRQPGVPPTSRAAATATALHALDRPAAEAPRRTAP
jgi:uncharacterized protein (TIGR00369 family)